MLKVKKKSKKYCKSGVFSGLRFFLFATVTDIVAEKPKQQFASLISEASENCRERFSILKERN